MVNWNKGLLFVLSIFLFSSGKSEDIRYFKSSTIPLEETDKKTTVSFIDAVEDREIYLASTSNGMPLHYFTELQEGICFDNKCRPLKILVYWNVTGRYLGFELIDGEYLSKYDHEPFTETEYLQLHNLLADPFLPLGDTAFEKLVELPETDQTSVDGISGATSKDVLEYVVEGAAYTTHKLWNVVHGPMQDKIMAVTEKNMDADLFRQILQSPDQSDLTWAIERLSSFKHLNESLIEPLIGILLDGEYFQSYLLLKTLSSDQMESEDFQFRLFNLIGKVDKAKENLIFDKLTEVSQLSPEIVDQSISALSMFNGEQLVRMLKLYSHHDINEAEVVRELKELIPHENKFVENQVVKFLEKSTYDSEQTQP